MPLFLANFLAHFRNEFPLYSLEALAQLEGSLTK